MRRRRCPCKPVRPLTPVDVAGRAVVEETGIVSMTTTDKSEATTREEVAAATAAEVVADPA